MRRLGAGLLSKTRSKNVDAGLTSSRPTKVCDVRSVSSVRWTYICQGTRFDSYIEALDKASPHNWLDDNFWLRKAYHEWRAPLLINSNWWLAFFNDKTLLQSARDEAYTADLAGVTFPQVRRAAWLVYRTVEFKDKLARYAPSSRVNYRI